MSSDCYCTSCGTSLTDGEATDRKPCPKCGSLARQFGKAIEIQERPEVYLKRHAKHRDGSTKVVREVIEGDDHFRKTGKWSVMRRIIDRTKNWYEESFWDRETGAILHKKEHPLSEHKHTPKKK